MKEMKKKNILMLLKLAYHQEIYYGHKIYFFMYCVNSKNKKISRAIQIKYRLTMAINFSNIYEEKEPNYKQTWNS